MFQRNNDGKSEDYKHNKEAVLVAIQANNLSLKMTRYVYDPAFKYHAIFRIRNHFKISTIGYFD